MREIFTYGSVGRAPGNRCLYPEADGKKPGGFWLRPVLTRNSSGPQLTSTLSLHFILSSRIIFHVDIHDNVAIS
jgi:hypothetical protein